MKAVDLTTAKWHKSTRSSGNGNCVEVAVVNDVVAVRDTKNRDGGTLLLPTPGWGSFLAGVKDGEFDL